MKINIKLLTLLAFTTLLFGCGNKWLGAIGPEDGTIAPPTQLFQTEAAINNAFTGTYDVIKEEYRLNHVTYGYKDYQLGLCYMGNDLMPNPDNWWTYEAQWDRAVSGIDGYQTQFYWYLFYNVQNNANAIIRGIEKDAPSTISESFKKASIAEAKAIRAWALFQLARVYQKSYSQVVDKNVKCLPYYTVPANDTLKGSPFYSVEQVYSHILSDLSDENIALIPENSANYRANRNVAYAWRAQIRLEMGNNWAGAQSDANKARAGYPLMSQKEFKSGFNAFNAEWIWGVPFQDDQAKGYASFFSFADMVLDPSVSGYQTFFVNDEYTKLFSATDCRALWFQYADANEDGTLPSFYWASSKFQAKANSFFNGDYVYIRSAEMLLIEAEAMARQGNFGEAANLLFELQSARDDNAVKSGKTGDALIDEILVERRKELFGEVPVEFIDAKRFGLPMIRNGNQPSINESIPASDPRWLFQIPRKEVDNNKQMKSSDQNPA